jgi:single-strand DNA-binding protein
MSGETQITVVGRLTADPDYKITQGGNPVVNFTVASSTRIFDKSTNDWRDGDALFMRCSLWRQPAENVTNSLHKGDLVIVTGSLKQRSYEKDGVKHTVIELAVDQIGPSLKYATAVITRVARNGAGSAPAVSAPAEDPWTGAPSNAGQDEPPF